MRVRFIDVGRGKANFTTEVPSVTADNLERALRAGTWIGSRDLSFVADEDSLSTGTVLAGWRMIGRWEIVAEGDERQAEP